MNIKVSTNQMDSTYYRIFFELAKEEGIEALLKLLKDLQRIEQLNLLEEAILFGRQRTVSLINGNKSVVAYLRKYKDELKGRNITHNPSLLNAICEIKKQPKLLDAYLKNALVLEKLKIGHIIVLDKNNSLYDDNIPKPLTLYKDKTGKIIEIVKYFSDGEITYSPLTPPKGINNMQASMIELSKDVLATWLIRAENHSTGRQFREIYIKDFGFNETKLPTEEELQSYELPTSLKLTLQK